jgi:hypothetical protein
MGTWETRIRIGGLVVAFTAFFVSLGCNTLLYGEDSSFTVGLACLLFGMSYPAWYSNLFLFLAGVSLRQKQFWAAVGCAVVALSLALSALLIHEIPRNEAGMLAPVIGYGIGYYLWVACGLVLLAAGLGCAVVRQKNDSILGLGEVG